MPGSSEADTGDEVTELAEDPAASAAPAEEGWAVPDLPLDPVTPPHSMSSGYLSAHSHSPPDNGPEVEIFKPEVDLYIPETEVEAGQVAAQLAVRARAGSITDTEEESRLSSVGILRPADIAALSLDTQYLTNPPAQPATAQYLNQPATLVQPSSAPPTTLPETQFFIPPAYGLTAPAAPPRVAPKPSRVNFVQTRRTGVATLPRPQFVKTDKQDAGTEAKETKEGGKKDDIVTAKEKKPLKFSKLWRRTGCGGRGGAGRVPADEPHRSLFTRTLQSLQLRKVVVEPAVEPVVRPRLATPPRPASSLPSRLGHSIVLLSPNDTELGGGAGRRGGEGGRGIKVDGPILHTARARFQQQDRSQSRSLHRSTLNLTASNKVTLV